MERLWLVGKDSYLSFLPLRWLSVVKNPVADVGLMPASGDPPGERTQPTPVFLWKSYGQRAGEL